MTDEATVFDCAHHLRLIAADVRSAGDVNLVRLSEDGVTPDCITLSDELWLIALRLDGKIEPLPDPDAPPAGSAT